MIGWSEDMKFLGGLIKRLKREEAPQVDTSGVTARILCALLRQCPVCNSGFDHHSYSMLGATILGEDKREATDEFFQAISDRRWADVLAFQDWAARRDNAEVYAVSCDNGDIAVLVVRSPAGFYGSDSLLYCEALTPESARELDSLIDQTRWKPLLS
jgi:hypothetical protein